MIEGVRREIGEAGWAVEGFVARLTQISHRVPFGYLLDLPPNSPPAERALISDDIYSKAIQYKTNARRGKIKPDPATDKALSRYINRQRRRSY